MRGLSSGQKALIAVLCVSLFSCTHGHTKPPAPTDTNNVAVAPVPVLPTEIGTSYGLAQTLERVGKDAFVVGRWDGTLSLFRLFKQGTGPELLSVAVLPSKKGVEATAALPDETIVTSHDEHSLATWTATDGKVSLQAIWNYDGKLGTATAARPLKRGAQTILVVGHKTGFLSFWTQAKTGLRLVGEVDGRSPKPLENSLENKNPLWDVRGLVQASDGALVSGSEDGDLVLWQWSSQASGAGNQTWARETARVRYSATAKRGVNGLALFEDVLAVTSCAVGSEDHNLHVWKIAGGRFERLESLDLKQDLTKPQVFSFAAVWSGEPNRLLWVSTQEGLLFQIQVPKRGLAFARVQGRVPIANGTGAALVYAKEHKLLVAAGHDVKVLRAP